MAIQVQIVTLLTVMGTAPSLFLEKAARPLSLRNMGRQFWVQTLVLVGFIVVLYGSVLADLAHDWWTEPALSQGLLIRHRVRRTESTIPDRRW